MRMGVALVGIATMGAVASFVGAERGAPVALEIAHVWDNPLWIAFYGIAGAFAFLLLLLLWDFSRRRWARPVAKRADRIAAARDRNGKSKTGEPPDDISASRRKRR